MFWLKKNIKYAFLICLFFSISSVGHTQITLEEGEVSIYGSYMYGTIRNKSFNTFADSYSAMNAAGLDKPMSSGFKNATGFTVGVRSLFGSINYMRLEGTAEAVFSNGQKRRVKNIISTPMNVGMPMIFGKVYVHPKFGFAQTTLNVSYEYPNGMESIGNETTYSGQYHTYGFYFGLDLGYSQKIGKHHRIEAGLSGSLIRGKRNSYTDFSHGRQQGKGYFPTSLPLDITAYGDSGIGYLDTGKGFVNGSNSMLSVYITYSFVLFSTDI